MMRSAALLCAVSLVPAVAGSALDNDSIKTAVALWLSDSAAAEAAYGHISTWDTSGVTDMNRLFCGSSNGYSGADCNSAASSFNEDIGAWDTSGVTDMELMFYWAKAFNQDVGDWAVHTVVNMRGMFAQASAFNQDLSGWAVQSVTDMVSMFDGASAFNQDLGWCVDDGVDHYNQWGSAFKNTLCKPTYCGVTRKNKFDECEAIVVVDDDDDDDDDDYDDDDCDFLGACNAATTRSAALAALVLGAALA